MTCSTVIQLQKQALTFYHTSAVRVFKVNTAEGSGEASMEPHAAGGLVRPAAHHNQSHGNHHVVDSDLGGVIIGVVRIDLVAPILACDLILLMLKISVVSTSTLLPDAAP